MMPFAAMRLRNPVVAGGTATYRYWRLTATDWASPSGKGAAGSLVRIAEWDLLVGATVYPTSNMTTNTAPSPLVASSLTNLGSGFEPFKAFDGNTSDSNRWISADAVSADQWLQIDLGSGNEIRPDTTKVAPDGGVAVAPNGNYIKDFRIEASNAGTFSGEQVTFLTASGLVMGDWTANTLKTFTLLSPLP